MAKWNSLTYYLNGVPNEITLTWPELDAIVGGVPPSAAKHRPWWSGDRPHVRSWKSAGFNFTNLQMGSQVTFVRSGSRSEVTTANSRTTLARSNPVVVEQDGTELIAADIVLVSCVKTKRPEAAAAKDLYISALFRKERSYAERSGVPWYILSAEHGLVDPEQWLAPYERYLPDESSTYREAWGVKVVDDLEQVQGLMEGKVIEIHAGAVYLEAIRSRLQSRGAVIVEPLRGLPMGKRLQWYDGGNRVPQPDVSRKVGVLLPDIDSLVATLRDESLAVSPKNFLAAGSIGRNLPGLYSWWVDPEGALELTAGLGHRIPTGMIYAGLAGATHWPSGKRSSNTLWLRIASMHLGSKHEFSTFRRTIGAILASAEGRDEIDEIALTRWMDLHLRVLVVPYEDANSLGRAEQSVLAELDPLLNLMGMPDTELRRRLKELRRAVVR